MANYDGEYEVRLFYSTVFGSIPLDHRMTFDVQPVNPPSVGADFDSIVCHRKAGGVGISLSTAIDALLNPLKDLYKTTSSFIRAELWVYAGSSLDASYVTQMALGEAGNSTGETEAAQQVTITFRSLAGYSARIQLMEPALGGNQKDPYPFVNVDIAEIATWATGNDAVIKARDNTFLAVPLNACFGMNERLWRKRFR